MLAGLAQMETNHRSNKFHCRQHNRRDHSQGRSANDRAMPALCPSMSPARNVVLPHEDTSDEVPFEGLRVLPGVQWAAKYPALALARGQGCGLRRHVE